MNNKATNNNSHANSNRKHNAGMLLLLLRRIKRTTTRLVILMFLLVVLGLVVVQFYFWWDLVPVVEQQQQQQQQQKHEHGDGDHVIANEDVNPKANFHRLVQYSKSKTEVECPKLTTNNTRLKMKILNAVKNNKQQKRHYTSASTPLSSSQSICSKLFRHRHQHQNRNDDGGREATTSSITKTITAWSIWSRHMPSILNASIHPDDVLQIHYPWTEQLLKLLTPHLLQRGIRSSPNRNAWKQVLQKVATRMQEMQEYRAKYNNSNSNNNVTQANHHNVTSVNDTTTYNTTTIPPPPIPLQVVVFGGSVTLGRECHKLPKTILPLLRTRARKLWPKTIFNEDCAWPLRLQWLLDMALTMSDADGGGGDADADRSHHQHRVVQVYNYAAGGTDTECALPKIQYGLYYPHHTQLVDQGGPDVIINAYATNDNWQGNDNGNDGNCDDPLHRHCLWNRTQSLLQQFTTTSLLLQQQDEEADEDDASYNCPKHDNNDDGIMHPPRQKQQQPQRKGAPPTPLVLYMDDYLSGAWNVLRAELQRHDAVQQLLRFHETAGHVSTLPVLSRLVWLSHPFTTKTTTNMDSINTTTTSTNQNNNNNQNSNNSHHHMIRSNPILKNGDESLTLLLSSSPQQHAAHFYMPGHVARAWIFAYALLQWTVDFCQDEDEHDDDDDDEHEHEHQDDIHDDTQTQHSQRQHKQQEKKTGIDHVDQDKEETTSTSTSTTTTPSNNLVAVSAAAALLQSMAMTRPRITTPETYLADESMWIDPPLQDLRFNRVSSEWKEHQPHFHQNHLPSSTASKMLAFCAKHGTNSTTRYDNANHHNNSKTTISMHPRPSSPCSFAFVAGPAGTHWDPRHFRKFIMPYLYERNAWNVEANYKDGFHNNLGLVALQLNASVTIRIAKLTSPVRVITVHYLKSYGETWRNSLALFQVYFLRGADGIAGDGVGKGAENHNETKQQQQQELITSFELSGFANRNISVSHVHRVDVGLESAAQIGDVVEIRMRLIGGSKFKLRSLLMCNR